MVETPRLQVDGSLVMCGIAGIISLRPRKSKSKEQSGIVKMMLDRLWHRGPDETNILVENQYSVGTARLKIVGENASKQPFYNKKSSLVFNGEIYNYKILAKEYLDNNIDLSSDSNVLFQFLNRYGLSKLNSLNGMFGFCYIDEENIYLARDRFGKKPLYYTIKNNCLLFASEVKAFIGLVNFEFDLPKFYRYLETSLEGETIFKNIFEIKPSTYMVINRKNMNISTYQYYSIFDVKEEKGSEKYLKEKLKWLVEDSIKLRTDTNRSYGVFISGGIDSSIIALLTKPQFLLTYLPQSSLIDKEDLYANIIASKLPKSTYIKIYKSRALKRKLFKTINSNSVF